MSVRQRTIRDTIRLEGKGLQTGEQVSVTFKPSPVNTGINFIRVDLPNKPLLSVRSLVFNPSGSPERRTTIGSGPLQIQTTEHLLAAFSGCGIDNAVIEIDNVELPGLDGSALDYVNALQKAGAVEQDTIRPTIVIREPLWVRHNDSFLAIFPDELFRISYTLSYPVPHIGTQLLQITPDEKNFSEAIAPARTFCMEEEAEVLIKRGLGKGASYANTLVIGKGGPVNNTFRFPDEPVRHKVLDLIGDLCLAGAALQGHVVAIKSGHGLNMELVNKIKSRYNT